ncbi:hypothetical protein GCK72_017838 [Caenorhabditis remanei]|uniref:Uncharacterized protein n=1 Tax=Caenorhabditis remanei TaxID=31234 RepID=A0A6A5G9I6_CAERE|nr:hypothetical protein GCK72_017838 [Caenorhabditis remanei]KAF1751284.1 hypothetical protein GCK72_017838 [Caenorhabditis remanei]
MRRRRTFIYIIQIILIASLVFLFYFVTISDKNLFKQGFGKKFRNESSSSFPRQAHLLDNYCKFAWTEPMDNTLKKRLKFPKRAGCEKYNIDLFKRYPATGEFSMKSKAHRNKLECVAQVLKGGLRPAAHTYQLGKTQTFSPKLNKRFWINANNFILTCFSGQLVIYRKQFMGFKMDENLKLVVDGPFEIPEPEAKILKSDSKQFSISILGLDSTSRAQFGRHMRKTTDLLQSMGSVVGDNSAVNLIPILADELSETENLNLLDETGDVNLNKILPTKTPLNPDTIQWIWKHLPPEYITMFNDDVMHTSRGLFHYPPDNFLDGFGESPARFYYRPYYNHLYSQLSNWWRKCLDGELLAEVFIDSWFRFERIFSKIPHFGFTFISSLTHDDPNNLEMLDHTLFHRLDYLNRTGSLENTILIILGDHGNRVHPLNRYTFAGKIEERAPYLSILVPPRFRKLFPEKYRNLRENSQRFVSNFHVHSTLKFITSLSKNLESSRRNKSLFELQPMNSTCQDNRVISNHCLCMVDASQDISKVPNPESLEEVLRTYLTDFNECFNVESLQCGNVTETLMPNNYVQVWARTKISDSEVVRKKERASAVIYPYLTCNLQSKNGDSVEVFTQFRLIQLSQNITIPYPPRLSVNSPSQCSHFSFPTDYCNCVDLLLAV